MRAVIRDRFKFILLAVVITSFYTGGVCASEREEDLRPVDVKAVVDKQTVTIGDKIRYTITVKALRDIEVQLPKFAGSLGGFAVRDFGSSQKVWWNKKIYKQWYILDTYTSGFYSLPKIEIKYRKKSEKNWHTLTTKEIRVKVKSVLPKGKKPSHIHDIAGPLYPSYTSLYLAVFLSAFVVLIAVLWLVYRKKKQKEEEKIKLPAHQIAYEGLNLLEEKNYISRGEIKAYYIELSNIVRHYIENRFDIHAPQMSTEEFLAFVKRDRKLSGGQKSLLSQFLYHCDLVKFARYNPEREEIRLSFDSAKRFIDETKEENTDVLQK